MAPSHVAPWGYHLWNAIHYVAMGYPEEPTEQDKQYYTTFLRSIGPVLPCKMCVNHFERLVTEEVPLDSKALESRETLFDWSVRAHNAVNKRLGKKVWSLEEARSYLLNLRAPDESTSTSSWTTWIIIVLLILLILILLLVLFKKYPTFAKQK
jgi:hypothetical protein